MTLILRTLHTIRASFDGPRFDLLNRNLRLQIARHGDCINISHDHSLHQNSPVNEEDEEEGEEEGKGTETEASLKRKRKRAT
jgi:hypothetical protein